jgi:hypothetical protein
MRFRLTALRRRQRMSAKRSMMTFHSLASGFARFLMLAFCALALAG